MEKRSPADRQEYISRSERMWFREYFRDKSIVVGSGPSVNNKTGTYIDMFDTVIRVNAFNVSSHPEETGRKTSYALFHMATRKGDWSGLSRSQMLLCTFGASLDVIQRRMNWPAPRGSRCPSTT